MSFPLTWNADFLDSQYRLWKADPEQVSREWQLLFAGFELSGDSQQRISIVDEPQYLEKQARVQELIYRYRDLGHLLACLDPLAACPTDHPLLSLTAFKLSEDDLDRTFFTPYLLTSEKNAHRTLRHILEALRETYCRSIGVEYMHLQDPDERRWLQKRIEPTRNQPQLDREWKIRILNKISQATLFEQFLHTKYVGQKRFSIEGAEVVIAMLDALLHHAADQGCREMVLGMAHRGRLNVQVNILQKLYEWVFCEFEDSYDTQSLYGAGDVKYHKGLMADIATRHGQTMRLLLATNPSHLEAVNPVVEGIARARQEQLTDDRRRLVMPLLIHGDAAFAGQGVVAETLNLSQLAGYHTGGTIHLVINNQIGFTTLPEHARSTRYATDIAKMLMVPIFHVHGEDPEAAVHVMKLACDYRMAFAKDVVIDVVCYRRYGHNEGDEPYYTQPQMYERIKDRPLPYQLYIDQCINEGVVTREEVNQLTGTIQKCLDEAYDDAHEKRCTEPEGRFFEGWNGLHGRYSHEPVPTGAPAETLKTIARTASAYPEGFSLHPRLKRILDRRLETVEKGEGIDWASAEMLAFGSLLLEGFSVRLSGQDSRRGTFSQRHSVLVDSNTGHLFVPLSALTNERSSFAVYDSMLSEYAVLGFEYGYSLASPQALVLWEAQFGDFANNAQAIIDQFIVSAESKWHRLSGLVLLLPHGFEGQGAEHSSARLERFLQLCAEDNIQVCYPTTPAQYFHLLRRQVKRDFRKPLVVMTPKSLLRHPLAVSTLGEMASGHFREILDDEMQVQAPRRVMLCSGKVYYDLFEKRKEVGTTDTAIVRVEQFYPFPKEQIRSVLARYDQAPEWVWVQEEPENMGGWDFMRHRLESLIGKPLTYIGRPEGASPATGHINYHREQQRALLERAFGG